MDCPKKIRICCPECRMLAWTDRLPTDPEQAATVEIPCGGTARDEAGDFCGANYPDSMFFDRDGRKILEAGQ